MTRKTVTDKPMVLGERDKSYSCINNKTYISQQLLKESTGASEEVGISSRLTEKSQVA